MSGHNKWSSIKHKKAAADAKRGAAFTKLIKEITVAARAGGGDPELNPRLRSAILAARNQNMPSDNIDRAVKKGTGELEGVTYEEITYEGYGPAGVAILVETLTDNKNRTVAEVRHLFSKLGGNMGESGCVAWMFTKLGLITVPRTGIDEDKLMETALEMGAEDFKSDDEEYFEVYTQPSALYEVRESLEKSGYTIENAEIAAVPQSTIALENKDAEKLLKIISALEDHDDVQKVYSNGDIPDEVYAAFDA